MKDSDFQSAQRSYDNMLPEPDIKVACKQCGVKVWESDMADNNICSWCDDENGFKALVKVMNQQ